MRRTGNSSLLWMMIMLALVAIISFWFLFLEFRGLTEPGGMEQAAIARETARGHGLTNQSVRLLDLYYVTQQADRKGDSVSLQSFPNTYHAPLNPLIESVLLSTCRGWWEVEPPAEADNTAAVAKPTVQGLYEPDRLIAGLAVLFFIVAIGVNYILISRLLDATIAGFTCLLLITCDMLWRLTLTGLPHMLLLLLFSLTCLFLHRALENGQDGRGNLGQLIAAGLCLGLMPLAHMLTLWIVVGAIIFAGLCIRPRPLAIGVLVALVLPGVAWWMFAQTNHTGEPFGVAFLSPISATNNGQLVDDQIAMRSFEERQNTMSIKDLPARLALGTIDQLQDIVKLFGGVIAAPLFFLALLQPFRRSATAQFRWALLLMWICAALGMAFYGLHGSSHITNQLHFLFVPLMSAYGLAMVAVLWNRLSLPGDLPLRRVLPLVIIALISALPLSLNIARNIHLAGWLFSKQTRTDAGIGVSVNAMRDLRHRVKPGEYVFSDTPWAVAWYADRPALWMPLSTGSMVQVEANREKSGENCIGLLFSMATLNQPYIQGLMLGPDSAFSHLTFEITQSMSLEQRKRFQSAGLNYTAIQSLSGSSTPYYLFENPETAR